MFHQCRSFEYAGIVRSDFGKKLIHVIHNISLPQKFINMLTLAAKLIPRTTTHVTVIRLFYNIYSTLTSFNLPCWVGRLLSTIEPKRILHLNKLPSCGRECYWHTQLQYFLCTTLYIRQQLALVIRHKVYVVRGIVVPLSRFF